jgi:hypothetical protein
VAVPCGVDRDSTRAEARRKRQDATTDAYEDWKAECAPLALHEAHRGYSDMGRYRRECARRRLNEGIRSRHRREQTLDVGGLISAEGGPDWITGAGDIIHAASLRLIPNLYFDSWFVGARLNLRGVELVKPSFCQFDVPGMYRRRSWLARMAKDVLWHW